jgi:toxin FitB
VTRQMGCMPGRLQGTAPPCILAAYHLAALGSGFFCAAPCCRLCELIRRYAACELSLRHTPPGSPRGAGSFLAQRWRRWGTQRRAALDHWRRRVVLLPFDERVATTWGDLQGRAQLRGRPRPVNDTWIAACCLVERFPLATFNTRDFGDFAEHDDLVLDDVS